MDKRMLLLSALTALILLPGEPYLSRLIAWHAVKWVKK